MITRIITGWLGALVLALAPISTYAQVSPDNPLEITAPAPLTVFDVASVEIKLLLDPSARLDTLVVRLNNQDITALFSPTTIPGELSATVGAAEGLAVGVAGTEDPTKDGANVLTTTIRSTTSNKKDRDYSDFYVILPAGSTSPDNPLTIQTPDQVQQFSNYPVDIIVNIDASAQLNTFAAKLNGIDITGLFTPYTGGLSASVGPGEGLIVATEGDGTDGHNTFQASVQSFEGDKDRDFRSFFVVLPLHTNQPPVAHAGADQTVTIGTVVQLDGSVSTDPDGDPITYAWSFLSIPAGSSASLSDPTLVNPTFVADVSGDYTYQLIVNDGEFDSAPDTVIISTSNSAPVADAGPDQSAHLSDIVQLDGSGSSDPDGDSLTFTWNFESIPVGSTVSLSDTTAVNPTFLVDVAGDYVLRLIVNDGVLQSAPDYVTITNLNTAPVADAGSDQSVYVTDLVLLDGTGSSDADGDPITHSWSFSSVPAGSTASLSNPTAVSPSFVADKFGDYVVQLIVSDGMVASAPDSVIISTLNSRPVADAGLDQVVAVGDGVLLDGSGSHDIDGDALTFSWSLTSVPAGSAATLSDPFAVMPDFVADKAGTYVVQLIVNDGSIDSNPDSVTITTSNTPPVGDAGPDQTAQLYDTVILDGSGSYDIDGDPITYSWSFDSKPAGSTTTLNFADTVDPDFFVDAHGVYVIDLIVNDGQADSALVGALVITINTPPVGDAGPDQTAQLYDTVILDGSGSYDIDGDPITYSWSFDSKPAGSTTTLNFADTVDPDFFVDAHGVYVIDLIVNDGQADSALVGALVITINTPPVGDAGPDQTAQLYDTVILDGSGSSDIDGDPITYSWSFESKPAGSTTTLNFADTVDPDFFVDAHGVYVIDLIVNDGQADSALVGALVITINTPPVGDAGPDQTAQLYDTVILDGSGSSDIDGDPITYSWSFESKPAGSTTTLNFADTVDPDFFVDAHGVYVIDLIVNDGQADSALVGALVITINTPPVGDAGPDQTAQLYDTVILDGSGSSDIDGDPITYSWSFESKPAGSTTTLNFADTVDPDFFVDAHGVYVIDLIVNDGQADSALVGALVITINTPPVGDAGPDQTAQLYDTVILDGSGSSDIDGDPITYSWSFESKPAGSTTTLNFADTVDPDFFVDAHGVYVIDLIVNDGQADSALVGALVITINTPPVADAGPDQTALVEGIVSLDGSGSSDVDGDALSFSWAFTAMPSGSVAGLNDPSAVSPFFTPDLGGSYVLELAVFDGSATSVDAVVVMVTAPNNPPVADAGIDQIGDVGDTILLDGSGSFDPDDDSLFYAWSFVSVPAGSAATLSDVNAPAPSFVIDVAGTYEVQLIVNDGQDDSAPDTMLVQHWAVEVVDSTGDVGSHLSLAVDSANNPHIAYYDATNTRLLYAKGEPTTWNVVEVDNTGATGDYCAIDLDSAENPHISYHYVDDGPTFTSSLRYASFDGTVWGTVDADTLTNPGYYTSLAIGSDDFARIGNIRSTGYAMLATQSAAGWSRTQITGSSKLTRNMSLVLDAEDHVHMAYVNTTSSFVTVAYYDGASWQFWKPAPVTQVGDVAIEVDDTKEHFVVWVDQASSDLMLSYSFGSTILKRWANLTLDPGTAVDGGVSLVIDSSNVLYISYYDSTNGDLKYATGTVAGGFTYEVVDSAGDVGVDSDISLDASDKPHIVYYDSTNGDVKYAHK